MYQLWLSCICKRHTYVRESARVIIALWNFFLRVFLEKQTLDGDLSHLFSSRDHTSLERICDMQNPDILLFSNLVVQ